MKPCSTCKNQTLNSNRTDGGFFLNRPITQCIIVCLFFLLSLLSCQQDQGNSEPQAKKGVIDLQNWDFQKDGSLYLNGNWSFYWNTLYSPDDFLNTAAKSPSYETVPGRWNRFIIDGQALPSYGYATFRLLMFFDTTSQTLALDLPVFSTAYSLWINGKLASTNGIVSKEKESYAPHFHPRAVTFEPAETGINELVLHLANYTYQRGGIWFPIKLGTADKILIEKQNRIAYEAFLMGALLIIGIYHLIIFILRKDEKAPLYLTGIALALAFRTMATGERFLFTSLESLPLSVMVNTEYIAVALTILFSVLFIKQLFPYEVPRFIVRFVLIFFPAYAVFVLLSPMRVFTRSDPLIQSFVLFTGLYIVFTVALAKWRKREGAGLYLIGVIFFAYSIINDLLVARHIIYSINLAPFGFFILLTCQSFILAIKFSNAFNDNKALSIELKQTDKLKDDFLANTSHELRTPLNGIIGISDSLIEGATGSLSIKTLENLKMISLSGRRLAKLVNDLLDFSKIRKNELSLQIKTVSIKQAVDLSITLASFLQTHSNLPINNTIKEDTFYVLADEDRLQQILINIIGNALKFTKEGHVDIFAEEFSQNGTPYIRVSVKDTGIGIPQDQHEKIFQTFYQGDTSIERSHAGTGLGLAISKQLLELQDGFIALESSPDEGSCFTFSLPAVSTCQLQPFELIEDAKQELTSDSWISRLFHKRQEESLIPLEDSVKTSHASNKMQSKILAVDDEPINLHVLQNHLNLEGYEVVTANSGQRALDYLSEHGSPDLILLDVMMPIMSGYELCRKIRETYPIAKLPIIMLTAKNQLSNLVEGLRSGANDYISKPFVKQELIARIQTHLNVSEISKAYERFVPKEILHLLDRESIVDLLLGDHVKKDMGILFADIRSFTSLSETMTPEENFNFLNSYLRRIGPLIRKHHGFIDKYIGDGIMALFPDSGENALKAAIDIQNELVEYNQNRGKSHYKQIQVAIGVHYGSLILGTIGENQRMEGTVISDAVNLASRIEGFCKDLDSQILISDAMQKTLENPDSYTYRTLESVQLKGKSSTVNIVEVLDGLPDENRQRHEQTKIDFEKGIQTYAIHDFSTAISSLEKVIAISPKDTTALHFLKLAREKKAQSLVQ